MNSANAKYPFSVSTTKWGGGTNHITGAVSPVYYHVYIARLYPHRYGPRTAYGERTVLKPKRWKLLDGTYPTRLDALRAGRAEVARLQAELESGGGCIRQ